ncbi:alpha/beta-hydrolase [Neocallimastix lanati (nom. inval.)]|jgi:carboxylesterase type B|uniref:Alpha/beta-hydrolase n=1 Tax=Neocallimastix californiae TaxID=1754190 RepID=A0A1Y2E7N9_9FUNG|nr:alpha/beta-hydrolase [Neocallimastix sp. JGI-2020a]ORY66875.1 alpha/beta-hydrolase [Neocallimastix californiae]|eukprot:ORY66875.1 alpha/beta-hydrolase [Neocallimastix californiae]
MKSITILAFLLSALLLCNAFSLSGLSNSSGSLSNSISNSLNNYINELKDKKRDLENYLSYKNIDRDIKFNCKRALDVYYDKENTSELKPVVIFIYGGSWYSGDKVKFTKFGSLLESNGYVAVLPNYILFPYGGFEDMVEDIYKSIQWTFKNIKKYGGDPERISIAAYSAGSHLTALTLLKSVFSMENNGEELAPFETLEKVVLLNGPYDFDDFSVKFLGSDPDIDNSLIEKLAKIVFRTPNVSPTDILKAYPDGSVTSLGAKKFVFFYTSLDQQVTESSANNFMAQMKRVYPEVDIEYVYKEGYEHTTVTRGVRAGQKEEEDVFMSLVNL